MPTFAISNFLRQRAVGREYEHRLEEVMAQVAANFSQRRAGYREGVVRVPITLPGLNAGVVTLMPDEVLTGQYAARVPGEEPRQKFWVERATRTPAGFVEAVCYHRDVLAEDGDASGAAEWKVVTILAWETDEEAPIHPDTLIANHFQLSGGTSTKMNAATFEAELRKSVLYWKSRANAVYPAKGE